MNNNFILTRLCKMFCHSIFNKYMISYNSIWNKLFMCYCHLPAIYYCDAMYLFVIATTYTAHLNQQLVRFNVKHQFKFLTSFCFSTSSNIYIYLSLLVILSVCLSARPPPAYMHICLYVCLSVCIHLMLARALALFL